jgi:hypothetical protein
MENGKKRTRGYVDAQSEAQNECGLLVQSPRIKTIGPCTESPSVGLEITQFACLRGAT